MKEWREVKSFEVGVNMEAILPSSPKFTAF